MATELTFAKYVFYFKKVILLESHFEKIVSVINLNYFPVTLSVDDIDLVFHEE